MLDGTVWEVPITISTSASPENAVQKFLLDKVEHAVDIAETIPLAWIKVLFRDISVVTMNCNII